MEIQPLVSIITPSYNQGQYLEETIQSVLNQDYPNIEYIIIDGGSVDSSVEVIQKYQNRLAYWVSENDQGQTHALMKGFKRAHGQYLTWLCSDDVLEPSMVSVSVDYHLRHPSVGVTFGDRIRIDSKGNIYSLQRYPSFRSWYIKTGFSLPQETSLIKKEVFDNVGGLDEKLQMAMDFDLWCKINQKFPIHHIPAILGRFRAHNANKSSLFSHQTSQTGFDSGFPAEFSTVFERYFGRVPSKKVMFWGKILRLFLGYYDRRTKFYRDEIRKIQNVINS